MMTSRKAVAAVIAIVAVVATTPALAYEIFLKPSESNVAPNSSQVVRLINGTIDKSKSSISRDRMADVSIASNGRIMNPSHSDWHYDDDSSYLTYQTGDAGTYVIGVSTRPNIIKMSSAAFTKYLTKESILGALAAFENENSLSQVRERYSKYVRTIVQVGEKRTANYAAQLGYPVEIVLDQNPYDLKFGDVLRFQVLFEGKPVANQFVRASYEGFHGHGASGGHINSLSLRTDKDGWAEFMLSNKALWYIALIHMRKVSDAEADYESNWATTTFQVN